MRVTVVLSHPSATSFSATLARTVHDALAHHDVTVIDLYADGFNPVMSSQEQIGRAHV